MTCCVLNRFALPASPAWRAVVRTVRTLRAWLVAGRLFAGLVGLGVWALPGAAQAQLPRQFPQTALRGEMVVTSPPEILLNGQSARLSPGSRIRGDYNMMQLSGTLAGKRLVVNYTLDPVGLVHDVWILRPDEAAVRPWPRSAAEARSMVYDTATQTWSKP